MNKKILAIFANHSNSNTKNIISLHNLSIIEKYVSEICIIDSECEEFAVKLKDYLKEKNNITNYFFIPNDTYFDFGKWIYALNKINKNILNSYDYILFVNDSIIITPDIDKYFNYVDNYLDNSINLFAYNDSSQLEYHYQSYFFMIKPSIIDKLIAFFEEKKPFITNLVTLVSNIELCLHNLDKNHDCFIKIGQQLNTNKNLFWNNEMVYSYLLSINYFAILKYKRIYDIYREFDYKSTKKDIIDYKFFKENYNLNDLNNEQLLKYYLEEGFDLGMNDSNQFISLLPNYYRDKLSEMNLLYFFDIPNDFNIYYYKQNNPDLIELPIIDLIVHYINYGIYENRSYSKDKKDNATYVNKFYKRLHIKTKYLLPYDFNSIFYKNNYNDLKSLSHENIKEHYLNYGINENRIYKLPDDFIPENYKKYNKDLISLNNHELINHYINYGYSEERKYKEIDETDNYYEYESSNNRILSELKNTMNLSKQNGDKELFSKTLVKENTLFSETLVKENTLFSETLVKENTLFSETLVKENTFLPNDFYPLTYKKINTDLAHLNNKDLEYHYIIHGYKENRYYKLPNDYTNDGYRKYNVDLNKLNNYDLAVHFLMNGLKERRIYKIPEDFNITIYKSLNRYLDKFSDEEIIQHYINNGVYEKKYFRLNLYFEPSRYKKINTDLAHLNDLDLKLHFIKNGIKEKRKLF